MSDFTYSKNGLGAIWPGGAIDSSWDRLEPLITPEELVDLFLFGIPLTSGLRDPNTRKAQMMTPKLLERHIKRAVAQAETELSIDIFPTQIREKHPWDLQLYQSFGHFMTTRRPIQSIQSLTVTPSNDIDVYVVPLDWVETANLHKGQINMIPLTIALTKGATTAIPTSSAGGSLYLSIFGNRQWIPAFWAMNYVSGFPEGKLPVVLNDLIGTIAAMDVLSLLAATFSKSTSASVSMDGMSQSVSNAGPELFTPRIRGLQEKKTMLVAKLKTIFGTKIIVGNV